MFSLASEPLSIGRTLDNGIKLFLGSFKGVIGLSILASLILLIPQSVLVFLSHPSSGFLDPETGNAQLLIIAVFVFYLIVLLLYVPIWVAVCMKIWAYARQQDFAFGPAFWRGVKLILPMILMGICYVLAITGGFILLIIPGIYLTLSLSFGFYLIIIDNLKAIQSLKTSFSLVKGHWWRTAAVISVPVFIMIALYVLVGIALGIYLGVSDAMSNPDATISPMYEHMANLFSSLVSAVFTPLTLSVGLVVLHDLKLRNQGSDLMDKLQAMKDHG